MQSKNALQKMNYMTTHSDLFDQTPKRNKK